MPVFEMQAPNGRTFQVEAPDMESAARWIMNEVPPPEPPSPYEAEIQQFKEERRPWDAGDQTAHNIMFGFSDEVAGALGGVGSLLQGEPFSKGYEVYKEGQERRREEYQKEHPYRAGAASVFGSALTGAAGARALASRLPGWLSAAEPGISTAARVGRGGALGILGGGATGALAGFGEGEGGFVPRLENAAASGALGAAFGAPFGMIGGALGGTTASAAGRNLQPEDLLRHQSPQPGRQGAREIVEAFDRSGVEPNIPTASQNRGVGTMSAIVGDNTFGAPLFEQSSRQIAQSGQRLEEIADMVGPVRDPQRAGDAVQEGVERFSVDRVGVPAGQSAASLPSRATSFKTKAEALYDRVGRMMPKGRTAYLSNTRRALTEIENRFANPALQSAFRNADVQRVADQIRLAGDAGVTWNDLRSLRTAVRDFLENDDVLKSVPKTELDKLYAGLTKDMESMALNSGRGGSRKEGQKILHALNQADRFYAAGANRIRNVLDKVIKAKSGENVYQSLARMAHQGSGADWKRFTTIRRSLRDDEWDEVVSTTLSRLGQSPQGGEIFSPTYFLKNIRTMSPQGASLLFEGTRYKGLRPAIADLMTVAEQIQRTQRLGNPSGSGRMALHGLGLLGALYGTGSLTTALAMALTSAGGHQVAARVLSSPAAVRWLTNAARLADQGPRAAPLVSGSINALSNTFADEPEMAAALAEVGRQMIGEQEQRPPWMQ